MDDRDVEPVVKFLGAAGGRLGAAGVCWTRAANGVHGAGLISGGGQRAMGRRRRSYMGAKTRRR
jgi:hypothetical protein